MTIELPASSRILIEATLAPAQGHRFQPTGFPDLGAAEYKLHDGTTDVLVESAQSVANRLEAACWDAGTDSLVAPLRGLPFVEVVDAAGKAVTTSLSEAHRLNSPYILDSAASPIRAAFDERFPKENTERPDLRVLASLLFRYDPNSLLHGVFIAKSEIAGGRLRLARALSGFVEAHGVLTAESGGVKNDPVNPSGDAAKGYGNVPFSRTEYTADRIVAYFNLDLAQLRGYRLGADAERLLYALSLYKVHRFLQDGLRLRSACDLDLRALRVTRPADWSLPSLEALEAALPGLVAACAGSFASPSTTRVVTEVNAGARKADKAGKKAK
jgi:CRISPR-associated protein Csb1